MVSTVDKKTETGESPVRLCNYTDVYYNSWLTSELPYMEATVSEDELRRFGLRAGDVVITKDSETADDIAIAAYVPEDVPGVVYGYHLAVLRANPDVLTGRYLFWHLCSESARSAFSKAAVGITRFGLRSDAYSTVKVSVPTFEEQRAIADYLDAETARIDALIEKKTIIPQLLKERRGARLHSLLSEADGKFRTMLLGQVVRRVIDYRGRTPEKSEVGMPLVTASNVVDGRLDMELAPQFVPRSIYLDWMARGMPEVGDVLLTTEAPLGEVAVVADTGIALAQRIVSLRPTPRYVSPEYLMMYLREGRGHDELLARASGSTVMGIRSDRLRQVPVVVPPPAIQRAIVSTIAKLDERLGELDTLIGRQVAVLAEHRTALVTAAVTGKGLVAA